MQHMIKIIMYTVFWNNHKQLINSVFIVTMNIIVTVKNIDKMHSVRYCDGSVLKSSGCGDCDMDTSCSDELTDKEGGAVIVSTPLDARWCLTLSDSSTPKSA